MPPFPRLHARRLTHQRSTAFASVPGLAASAKTTADEYAKDAEARQHQRGRLWHNRDRADGADQGWGIIGVAIVFLVVDLIEAE